MKLTEEIINKLLELKNVKELHVYNDSFNIEFFEPREEEPAVQEEVVAKPKVAKPKVAKPKKDFNALDAMYNNPITEEDIAKEEEERNRKLREKFNNTGNVISGDSAAAEETVGDN